MKLPELSLWPAIALCAVAGHRWHYDTPPPARTSLAAPYQQRFCPRCYLVQVAPISTLRIAPRPSKEAPIGGHVLVGPWQAPHVPKPCFHNHAIPIPPAYGHPNPHCPRCLDDAKLEYFTGRKARKP